MTLYVALHVVDINGGNDDTGHETADNPANGSSTPTEPNVTLPVFVTTNEYVTTWPTDEIVVGSADLSKLIDGDCVAVTVVESVSPTSGPEGGEPDTVTVFSIDPSSTSLCVTL